MLRTKSFLTFLRSSQKSEKEPLRIWGHVDDAKKAIVPAESPVITTQCVRVPILYGHTAAAFVKFRQNPSKEELVQVADFCREHDLILFTDEIHGDLMKAGVRHQTALDVTEEMNDRLILASSPTKTFNIPGVFISPLH